MKTAEAIIEELERWAFEERSSKNPRLVHLEPAYCENIAYILKHYVYLSNEIRRLNDSSISHTKGGW